MRSSSLARVVIASFGVSVVITLGCGESPSGPSPAARLPVPPLSARPPVISELFPNVGSTGGGTLMTISGPGVGAAATVTVGGIVSTFEAEWGADDPIYLSTPAHAAGTVEVIVTDRYGQAATGAFTYVPPATFDFNGDWKGYAQNLAAWKFAHLELSIRNNVVVSVSCGQRHDGAGASSLTLDRPTVVANGGFSFASSGGDSITGHIVSPNSAFGSINMASCVPLGEWRVERK